MNRVVARLRSCQGFISVEAALVTGILLIGSSAMFLAVFSSSEAHSSARSAAQAGARAATLAQTPGGAQSAAEEAISVAVDNSGISCVVDGVDVDGMEPGNPITVSVSCTPDETGLGQYVTGSKTYTASATEIIDQYRTGETTTES